MIFVRLDLLHFKKSWTSSTLKCSTTTRKKVALPDNSFHLKNHDDCSRCQMHEIERDKNKCGVEEEEKKIRYTYIRYAQCEVMHSELSNGRSVTDGAVSVLMREFSFPWILPLICNFFFFCIFSRSRLSALNRAKPQKWVPIHTHCNRHCYCCLHLSVWCVWIKRSRRKMQCGLPKTSTRPDTEAQMNWSARKNKTEKYKQRRERAENKQMENLIFAF